MDWRTAEKTIGRGEDTDYRLELKWHEDRYAEAAPQLAALIATAGMACEADAYSRFDAAAIMAQARYRSWMFRANLGAFLTSVFSAFAMALSLLTQTYPEMGRGVLSHGPIILSALAAIAAALGTASLYLLRQGRLLENWMRKRATAETHRISYFDTLLRLAASAPAPVPMFALEYFRRYQFDVQRSYFYHRARDHERSSERTVLIGGIGASIATLSSFAGVLFGAGLPAMGAISVFGAALGAFAIGREQMTQDRRNAERYDRTYSTLTELARLLDEVRAHVADGRADVAREFAAAVNDQVSNEHRQWLEEAEAAQFALSRIEESLRQVQPADERAARNSSAR